MFMIMYKTQEICMHVTENVIMAIGRKEALIIIYENLFLLNQIYKLGLYKLGIKSS